MKRILMAALVATSFSPVALVAPAMAAPSQADADQRCAERGLPNLKWNYVAVIGTTTSVVTGGGPGAFSGPIKGPNGVPQNYHQDFVTPGGTSTETTALECRALNPQDKYNVDHSYNTEIVGATVPLQGSTELDVHICQGETRKDARYSGACPPA